MRTCNKISSSFYIILLFLSSNINYSDILCERLQLFLDLKKTREELNVLSIILLVNLYKELEMSAILKYYLKATSKETTKRMETKTLTLKASLD